MRKTIPVEEFNIKEIIDSVKKKQNEMILEDLKQKRKNIIGKIWNLSLNKIVNNNRPYLVDFEFIMNRLIKDVSVDQNIESMQIKLDITEQLEKMKKLPSLKTECYIESNRLFRCTCIISFIRKVIFRQKKYRIIFHNKEAKFDEQYYEVNHIPFVCILCLTLIMLAISIINVNLFFINFSLISLIILSFIWYVVYYNNK